MTTLTISAAKAKFGGIARRVVRSKRPVLVRVPEGMLQIAPYEPAGEVAPSPRGSIRRLRREVALGNTLGDTL